MNSGFCDTTSNHINIYNSGQSAVVVNNGYDVLCVDSTVLLSAFPNNGGLSYQWQKNGVSIPGATGNNYLVVDTGTYSCELSGICGNVVSNSFNYSTYSSKPRIPSGIFGNTKACSGDILNYSIVAPGNYDYHWYLPGGVVLDIGQGTPSITASFNQQFNGGLISVAASNACGSSAEKHLVIDKNLPQSPSLISGPVTGLCGGAAKIYSINPVSGASSYHWTVPTNANLTSVQGTTSAAIKFRNGFTNGNLTVYATNNCGNSDTASLFLSGRPLKPGIISGPTAVCAQEQNLNYSIAPVPSATSYSWLYPSDANVTSGTGNSALTLDYGSSSGAIGVRANNSCGSGLYRMINVAVVCRESDDDYSGIKVYPIPATDEFTLEVSEEHVAGFELKVTDVSGRMVIHEKVVDTRLYRFGKKLGPGVYYLTITKDAIQKSKVIIKTDRINN